MSVGARVSERPGFWYVIYLASALGTYFFTMSWWGHHGTLSELGISPKKALSMEVTYVSGALVLPLLTVSLQALGARIGGACLRMSVPYKKLWSVAAVAYMIPMALREAVVNLLVLANGRPTWVWLGVGLLGVDARWVDRMTDVFLLSQLYLFWTLLQADKETATRDRWGPMVGLIAGTLTVVLLT